MHIGKCGGTSVTEGLAGAFGDNWAGYVDKPGWRRRMLAVAGDADFLRFENSLASAVAADAMARFEASRPLVFGHIHFSPIFEKFRPHYAFVTLLREPCERVVSGWRYAVLRGLIGYDPRREPDVQFVDYLASEAGRHACHSFINFFGGLPLSRDYTLAYERGVENAAAFDLIGDLARPEKFEAEMSVLIGKSVRIGHRNRTSDRAGGSEPWMSDLAAWRPSTNSQEKLLSATELDRAFFKTVS